MPVPDSLIFELLPGRLSADRYSVDPITGGYRKSHIRRLFDLLHICEMRRDTARAQRIWSILIRCREVDFSLLWDLGLRLLHLPHPQSIVTDEEERSEIVDKYLGYLRACQSLSPRESSRVLVEYLCVLVSVGRRREAMDEVELYLPVLPYSEHSGLHEFAGMLALSIPQSTGDLQYPDDMAFRPQSMTEYLASIASSPYFRKAKSYFQRAQALDPSALMATGYLELLDESEKIDNMEIE